MALPDRNEKSLLDHVAKCLKVLQTFMTVLQGQTYFALAHAPFLLCRTLRDLEAIGEDGFEIPLGKQVGEGLIAKLKVRLGDVCVETLLRRHSWPLRCILHMVVVNG